MLHSAGVCPAPSPRMNRPFEITSRVAASLARGSGSRMPTLSTYVPTRRAVVASAATASAAKGDAVTPRWSATYSASKPESSAFFASSRHARGSAKRPACRPKRIVGTATAADGTGRLLPAAAGARDLLRVAGQRGRGAEQLIAEDEREVP